MKLRSLFLTAVMSIMLLLGGVVNAQDFDPCFGLGVDDCAVINEASANGAGDAEAFTLNVFIDFESDNIPDEVTSSIGFSLEGAIDIAQADNMLGTEFAGEFAFTSSMNGEDSDAGAFEVRLVEDIIYITDGGEAFSIDIVQLMESGVIEDQLGAAGLDMEADVEDVAGELPVDIAQVFALLDILNLPGLLAYERAGDDFTFTVDLSALQALLEEENEELLNTIVETASEIEPTAAFIIPVIPSLISSGIVEVNQTIDPDLNIVTDISFDMDLEMSLGALTTGDATAPATTVFLDTDFGISNLDDIDAIEPIEGAEDITEELLMGLGSALPAPAGD